MRTKIAAGNWKMYKNADEARSFMQEFIPLISETNAATEIVIFPPALDLTIVAEEMNSARKVHALKFGAQNIFHEKEGAFTGEISPAALRSLGAHYALVGHSERRTLFFETDEFISKKVRAAVDCGLIPMLCVGESLKEREAGDTIDVVSRQLIAGLSKVLNDSRFVIAYEPVWAIGTGKVATPAQAEEAHAAIRKILGDILGDEKAKGTSILYGGSVKPDNAKGLTVQPNIDGFLVGGASLKARDFAEIVNKI
jgi:triosephosphate isomerase (TIM)